MVGDALSPPASRTAAAVSESWFSSVGFWGRLAEANWRVHWCIWMCGRSCEEKKRVLRRERDQKGSRKSNLCRRERGMAMLSQAHKCFTSSFLHSSCTRATYPRGCLWHPLGRWRRELGFATPQLSRQSLGFTRTCGRLLVTASEGKKTWGEVAQNDQQQRMLQVVLVSPQIPGNTGCIARTCAATCVGLHLVEPMGFKIEDSKLKRAGLDYWPYVVVKVHKSWNDFFIYFQEQEGEKRLLAFTKKGRDVHTDVKYKAGDWLLFGSEVDGLPAAALEQCSSGEYAGGTVRLPMNEIYVRSLNLSVSAGIGVYEALRQLDSHTHYSTLDVAPRQPVEAVLSGHNDGYP